MLTPRRPPLAARIVAYPESMRILRRHLPGAAGLWTVYAVASVLPFLARQRFDANNWQTMVLTAAVPVMHFFSIYWNDFYARTDSRRYLFALGLFISLPLAAIGLAPNVWWLLACFLVMAFGYAGLSPLSADLLRGCYAPSIRGRTDAGHHDRRTDDG
jgi:MFS family permease